MILLRVHSSEGVAGLGEAVPLALRGGESLEEVASELRRLARRPRRAATRHPLSARTLCGDDGAARHRGPRRRGSGLEPLLGGAGPEPVPATPRSPRAIRQRSGRWQCAGPPTASDLQAQGRHRRRRRPGRAVREAVGPRGAVRVDANGAWAWMWRRPRCARSAARSSWPSSRWRPSRKLPSCAGATPIPLAGDESVATRADAERRRRARCLRRSRREARQGRRAGAGDRDRRSAPVLSLERPRGPGRDRGGRARRAGAAASGRRTTPARARPRDRAPFAETIGAVRVRAARRAAAPPRRARPRRRDRRSSPRGPLCMRLTS